MFSAFLVPRARALAASSSSVCNEFRQQLFPQGSSEYRSPLCMFPELELNYCSILCPDSNVDEEGWWYI